MSEALPHPILPLLDLARRVEVAKAQTLALEGDEARGFYWVERGAVRIHQISAQGRGLELGRFRAGEVVAAALAFADLPFPHHLEAVEDSLLHWFPRDRAFARITSEPQLAAYFLVLLSNKCRAMQARLQAHTVKSLRDRLLDRLQGLSCRPQNGQFELDCSKKDLAAELGVTPEALSRMLKSLKEEGVLEVQGRSLRWLSR